LSLAYNDILQIPERALINKRLTKVFFTKNFVLNAAEKKFLVNDIVQMDWLASIKPSNVNIKAIKNNDYSYEELQVFVIQLKDNQLMLHSDRAIKLIQKYIPYQAMVIVEDGFEFVINVCDKRINKADNSKRTIEQYWTTQAISKLYKNEKIRGFFNAIHFESLDKTDLQTTYRSYLQAVVQLQAASHTGNFKIRTKARSSEDMELLATIELKQAQIAQMRTALKKETQLNNQVNMNVAVHTLKKEIEEIKKQLSEE
jgi:hypothetical protein